jgi:Cysteine-rich secretory protein family
MTTLTPDLPQTELAIIKFTNSFRAKNNLAAAKPNTALAAAARAFAAYLVKSGIFSHTADGREPSARVKAAGYDACLVGENLGQFLDSRGFETKQLARDAVEGWINSPGHRATLLTEGATDIGIAIVKAPAELRYTVVQLFARPQTLSISFQVANSSGGTVKYAVADKPHEIQTGYSARHTTCLAPVVHFNVKSGQANETKFDAMDGDLFTLKSPTAGGIAIEKSKRETLPQ